MRGRAAPGRGLLYVKGTDCWPECVAGAGTGDFGRISDETDRGVEQFGIPLALPRSEAAHRFPQNAVDIETGCIAKSVWQ